MLNLTPLRILSLGLFIVAALLASGVVVARQGQTPQVVTVSAADFQARIAPDSIVATFGAGLSTTTLAAESLPLPTELGGTTVTVRDSQGRDFAAPLLFVSPAQINHLIPGDAAPGAAQITVRSGNGSVVSGAIQIVLVAPAIFTANQDGRGAPAAMVLRVGADGRQTNESPSIIVNGRFIPRPVDLGPEDERVFLVLFLTGLRNAPNTDGNNENGSAENVRVLIGGVLQAPLFAGAQGSFAGLDQVNVEIPRTLLDPSLPGSRQINVSLKAPGFTDSNEVEIALAPVAGSALAITGFDAPPQVLAHSEIQLNGAGISPVVSRNKISFGEGAGDARPGEIRAASATQLSALVPFGAVSGLISVNSDGRSWTSESPLAVRTSVSALVLDTDGQPFSPLFGGRVCFPNCSAGSSITQIQRGGWFVLPDPPPGNRRIFVIEAPTQPGALAFNRTTISSPIVADRDNPLPQQVYLQAIYGPSAAIGSSSGFKQAREVRQTQVPKVSLSIEGFNFTLPVDADATFPDGTKSGVLTLTPVKNSLTPVPMPPAIFSSAVVQISPFGVALQPGGALTFPNRDGLGPNPAPTLFKYDINNASFIDTGIRAELSEDGRYFTTPDGAITETSIYFVAVKQKTTTIAGRVLESDDSTPVKGVVVSARGRFATTDGNGGYSLAQVPTGEIDESEAAPALHGVHQRGAALSSNAPIILLANYLRPSGRADTTMRNISNPVTGGITDVSPLLLPPLDSNRPPSINVAGYLTIYATETRQLPVLVTELDDGQMVGDVTVGGADFAALEDEGGGVYSLRLSPQTSDVGQRLLTITATDSEGGSTSIDVTVIVFPLPAAAGQTKTTTPDTPVAIALQGIDADNLPLTFAIVSPPANGTLSGAPPEVIYTPGAGFLGTDSFTFKASNGIVEGPPAAVTINVIDAAPVIQALSPASVVTIDGAFELKVFGEGFAPGAMVRFNGAARQTTFISENEVRAQITEEDVAKAGAAPVTVFNPAQVGGESNLLIFTILNPEPIIESLMPDAAISEHDGFFLTVKGIRFTAGSIVFWNGAPRFTEFLDSSTLLVTIPTSDIAAAGIVQVTANNPEPGGGVSNAKNFTINNPLPVLASIDPTTANAGDPALVLTVTGMDFRPPSVVRINGSDRPTIYISSTMLTAQIAAGDLIDGGGYSITVFTPGPGGGISEPQTLTVYNLDPLISYVSRASTEIPHYEPLFTEITYQVIGSHFVPSSKVKWDGNERPTTYISSTQLLFQAPVIPIGDANRAHPVKVINPEPGGGESNAGVALGLDTLNPEILSANPASAVAGGPDFTLAIEGNNFTPGSVLNWNGNPRPTTVTDTKHLTAVIPASDISASTTAVLTVTNPAPVHRTSNLVNFAVIPQPTPPGDAFHGIELAAPAVVILPGGDALLLGGLTANTREPSADVDFYNPATGQRDFAPPMTRARAGHTATLLASGEILVVGGIGVVPETDSSAEIYDPATGAWRSAAAPRFAHVAHTSIPLRDGRILVIGGMDEKGEIGSRAEIYDPVADQWMPASAMLAGRAAATAVLLDDGRVLVAGGIGDDGSLAVSEIYDPQTGVWTSTGELHLARLGHTMTRLSDGRVLIAGGTGEAAATTSEVYDPLRGDWEFAGNPGIGRMAHSAMLLRDGRVMITGGRDTAGRLLRECEIYDPQTRLWVEAARLSEPRAGHTSILSGDGRPIAIGGRGLH
ncbi:MAG: IPT/TIG domain-containing protein [Acidobacteria bacterium]|nr:IPT/TIG domain-containing protein [Acidobacteriota bacterium]